MDNSRAILVDADIIENREITPGFFLIHLNSAELANLVRPGQFFYIKIEDRMDIILRRPLSVFDYDDKGVKIIYEVVGKGTRILSEKRYGETVNTLGPLGNGFSLPDDPAAFAEDIFIVGGGVGIAPLFCWTKYLIKYGKENGRDFCVNVMIGAKNKYRVLCEADFRGLGLEPKTAVEDGSAGYKGFVTCLLRSSACGIRPETVPYIYACGPTGMLKEISSIMEEKNIKGRFSVDRHMGCGMGACLGCMVKMKDGSYKRACKDGPVFDAGEIMWE